MIDDPIVEEIHRIRDRMLAECGGDFEKYMDRIREAQEQDRDRLVTKEEVLRRKHGVKEEPDL
jgi:methyltransferase-like protein